MMISLFKTVFESPACLDGKPWPVDDYMPRAQINNFAEIAKEIAEFSVAFVVSEELVPKPWQRLLYIGHIYMYSKLAMLVKARI